MVMRNLLVVAVALTARAAWPCSGYSCQSGVQPVPKDGAVIPANAPAVGIQSIIFSDASADGGTTTWGAALSVSVSSGSTSLTGPSLPSPVGFFISVPPMPVGSTWVLEPGGCEPRSTFTVGPPAALPTVSAGVDLLETQYQPFDSSSCGASPPKQVARLRITATPQMVPWLPLARWELEVDGRNVTTARFGTVGAEPFAPELRSGPAFLPFNTFGAECFGPSPWSSSTLQPGLHAVRVLARIEGLLEPIPSNTVSVQLDCPPGTPEPQPDGGAAQPRSDGGVAAAAPRSGCAVAPGSALVALLLPVALTLRRRRPRSGRAPGAGAPTAARPGPR